MTWLVREIHSPSNVWQHLRALFQRCSAKIMEYNESHNEQNMNNRSEHLKVKTNKKPALKPLKSMMNS